MIYLIETLFKLETLDVEEGELIEKWLGQRRCHFPAVYIGKTAIYFNSRCVPFLDTRYIRVSKSTNLVCFRPSDKKDSCYKANWVNSAGISISGASIKSLTGLKTGDAFRLYRLKDGGYAIKRYEPIDDTQY